MSRKTQVLIIAATSILTAYAAETIWSLITGEATGPLKWISLAATVVGSVLAAVANVFWRWLWRRVPILGKQVFPDLNGTWNGHLLSTWVDPETGTSPPPIETTVTIVQSLLSTHVTLQTGESRSESTRAFLEPSSDTGRYRIWYSYNNDPQAQVRHRSSPHEGVAFLEVFPDVDPDKLEGRYYTARKTTGDMVLRRQTVS